ncbi:MAG: hypothetical protein WCY30_07215 [Candidatus Neomarinimicrobiota bacterium]|jgi:hypothetical protein
MKKWKYKPVINCGKLLFDGLQSAGRLTGNERVRKRCIGENSLVCGYCGQNVSYLIDMASLFDIEQDSVPVNERKLSNIVPMAVKISFNESGEIIIEQCIKRFNYNDLLDYIVYTLDMPFDIVYQCPDCGENNMIFASDMKQDNFIDASYLLLTDEPTRLINNSCNSEPIDSDIKLSITKEDLIDTCITCYNSDEFDHRCKDIIIFGDEQSLSDTNTFCDICCECYNQMDFYLFGITPKDVLLRKRKLLREQEGRQND